MDTRQQLSNLSAKMDKLLLNSKKAITIEELSEKYGLSKSTIYKLTSTGRIPFYKPTGKKIYFDSNEIEKWLLSNRNKTIEEINADADTYVTLNPL